MRSKLIIVMAAIAMMAGLSVLVVSGSSHREAPLISQDPAADTTDVYAWVEGDPPSKVNLLVNVYPAQEPNGGPNFYRFADDVLYEIRIDNDGDAGEEIVYQFRFTTHTMSGDTFLYNTGPITSLDDPDWNVRQTYSVTRQDVRRGTVLSEVVLGTDLATPPVNIGPVSTPDYEDLAKAAVYDLGDGVKVFAGQRDDSFFVELGGIFDRLSFARVLPGNVGGGVDGLGAFNVQTMALQVPISHLTSGEEPVIGIWATSSRNRVRSLHSSGSGPTNRGDFIQVSRLGMPLVNEVVIPLADKDKFNASKPRNDVQFLSYVTDPELAARLNDIYGDAGLDIIAEIPETGRSDMVAVFLTGIPGLNMPADVKPAEMLRLNTAIPPTSTPNRLGVIGGDPAGFPNGRRLGDDVTDIAIRVVTCGYGFDFPPCVDAEPNNMLGDGVDANDVPFLGYFPYAATPHQGFEHPEHHPVSPGPTTLGIGFGLFGGGIALGAVFAFRRRRNSVVA